MKYNEWPFTLLQYTCNTHGTQDITLSVKDLSQTDMPLLVDGEKGISLVLYHLLHIWLELNLLKYIWNKSFS